MRITITGAAGCSFATHSGQVTFSKPVRQPNSCFGNWSANKRPLATSPHRPIEPFRQAFRPFVAGPERATHALKKTRSFICDMGP